MKKTSLPLKRIFAGTGMAALCIAPVIGEEDGHYAFNMHSSFVHACSDDESRQAVYPLTMDYMYNELYTESAQRVVPVIEHEVKERLADLVNYGPIMDLITHDSGASIMRGAQMDTFKVGIERMIDGQITLHFGGSTVFAPGCEKQPISQEWYSTHLTLQDEMRAVLLERNEIEKKERERVFKEEERRLMPSA